MSARKNIKVVESLYQAFGEGSVDGFLSVLTEDVVVEMPRLPDVPLKDRYKGKKGVLQFLKDREPAIKYDKFLPQDFIGQGDIVVVLGETRGKALTTGKRFRHQWAQVFRFREGKIASIQEYLNANEINTAFIA